MNFQFLGVRREVLGGGLMGLRREERRLGGQAARVRMPAVWDGCLLERAGWLLDAALFWRRKPSRRRPALGHSGPPPLLAATS